MRKERISTETKLMLCCARVRMNASIRCQLQELLQSPLDWNQIIEQSHYHEILHLVYYNLNKIHKQDIPVSIFTVLKNSYYATLAKNMHLWKELCCIQDAFNKAGIKLIPLKGIILAETLYHNLGLRPMVDIDVLVQEKDLLIAERQLIQLGYRKYLKVFSENYYRKYDYHFQFCNPNKNITLELHWAFAPSRPNKIDLTDVWRRSQIQISGQREILILSPEDTLLSLCLHICKVVTHLQHLRLKKLCDIHELITQYNHKLNWNYIVDKVTTWKLKGAFYYLYLLTKRYFDTPWPVKELPRIRPHFAQRTILNFLIPNLGKTARFRAYLLMLAITDTTIDRFALALQKLFIFTERMILSFSISRHDNQR